MRIIDLESLFMSDPTLSSVVVLADQVSCITRTWFFDQLIGPLGYGRGLYGRREVSALPECSTLTLDAETPIVEATQAVLLRPEVNRYDDVVVRFANGEYCTFRVAELFAELAHLQAYGGLHDALTGLPNRRLFFDCLSEVHGQALVEPKRLFAVLFVDLDDFKTINDGLGHDAGDTALLEAAHRLSRLDRSDVTVARLGGDEFGMLVESLSSEAEAHDIAEQIAQLMNRPLQVGAETVALSASVGVAIGPDGASPDEMMRNADLAMYSVKHRRKGQHAFYDRAMHTRARERLEMRGQLDGALERGEFRLVYQPVVEMRDELTVGAEALLRWERPGEGLVSPAEFIPLCEQTGLIVPLGRWVLESACRQAVTWIESDPLHRDLLMSVNISPRQLQEAGFADDVKRILRDTGLPAAALVLEITESSLIENLHDAVEHLLPLKRRGVQVALDDFGTGFSSLGYLAELPIDIVKLDRSFVNHTAHRGLIKGIVALAHSLNQIVIAEGIEEAQQARDLQAAECYWAQGFHFARPMEVAGFTEWLARPVAAPGALVAA